MATPNDAAQPSRRQSGRIGFNGELLECITGHYMLGNGYRAYSPLLMIFIQPDSWSPFGAGGLNAYAYCKGDPVNAADPTGHMPLAQLLSPGRVSRSPSPPRFNIPAKLPELLDSDVIQTLAGLTSHPVPGPSAGRVSPPPILAGTAPVVSQSSSALPTPAASAGPSGFVVARNHHDVDYKHVEREIERMVPSHDAEGIVRLSTQDFHRLPVLAELRWQLLRRPGETRPRYATRELAPKIGQRQIRTLEKQAMNENDFEKAHFYKRLHDGFTEANRKRIRKN